MLQQQSRQRNQSAINPQQSNEVEPQEILQKLIGIFYIPLATFSALAIIGITATILNKQESQIIILGSIIIFISITIIIAFSHLINYLKSPVIFIANSRNVARATIEEVKVQKCYFVIPQQFQITSFIKYQFLYCAGSLILLIQKVIPHYYTYCDGTYYYERDENNGLELVENCYYKQEDAVYQGPLLQTLGICSLTLSIILLIILLFVHLLDICRFCKQKFHPSTQQFYLEKFQSYALAYQLISMSFSLIKIVILCTIANLNQNKSSTVLICSNIYFHIIIIIIGAKNFLILNKAKNVQQQLITNYISPIESVIYYRNRCNNAINFFIVLNMPFLIFGATFYHKSQSNEEIINFDIFIQYDCLGMQFFVNSYIIILLFLNYFDSTQQVGHEVIQPVLFEESIILHQRTQQQQQQQQEQQQQQQQLQGQQQQQPQPYQQVVQNQNFEIQQRNNNSQNFARQQRKGLLPSIKKKSEPYIYKNISSKNQDCTICLQSLNQIDSIVQLKCHKTHIFHKKCIDQWLIIHKKCPICKTEF